jgi:hypothetical protein
MGLYALMGFIAVIAAGVELWVVTRRVRKRMKKTMGRNPSDLEMASLNTWMKVEQEEDLNKAVKSIYPE